MAILIIVGLSLLVLIHEAGHFIAARQAGIKIEEFGFGFPPRIKGWQRGETLYSLNWLPFGGFVRINGEKQPDILSYGDTASIVTRPIDSTRAFYGKSFRQRFVVIAAGISINFLAGWFLFSLVFMFGAREAVVAVDVLPSTPAATIGLERGDEFVGFTDDNQFIQFTHAHRGELIPLVVRRGGQDMELKVQLRSEEDQPPLGAAISKIGFARLPIFASIWKGLTTSVDTVAQIFKAFGGLILDLFTSASIPENIVGPIGIFGIAGDIGRLGFVYILQLIGMISLNLAALNAIPFPALDGGRILFMIIEKVKGAPLNPKREMWANITSFGFLILLMLAITGRDIVRLF